MIDLPDGISEKQDFFIYALARLMSRLSSVCLAGVGAQWDFSGSTLVTSSYVRLTPDERSKQGSIWNIVVRKDCEHSSLLHSDTDLLSFLPDSLLLSP